MTVLLPDRPRARGARFQSGRGHGLLAFGLVLLVFLAALLGSFHHHHAPGSHADCAVCAAAQHPGTPAELPFLPGIILPDLPVLFVCLLLRVPVFRPASHLRSRAPPR